jgi:vacuolar-type H+-ATPase subunit D/Vma8
LLSTLPELELKRISADIQSQIYYIQQVLDQQEQEDIFRLKRIKGKVIARS